MEVGMNEKLQYASMLEIPVNSCNVTYTKIKRKKHKSKQAVEKIKQEVLDKVNASCEVIEKPIESVKENKKRKIPMVTASMIIIGVLVAVIFLTNALYQESGLAVFFKNVFSSSQSAQLEEKDYSDYTPVVALANANVNLNEGLAILTE